jgi:PAS domain S-box-containing protein
MMPRDPVLQDSAAESFEGAPCGYLTTLMDGSIIEVNRTFEAWTGFDRRELLAGRRFQDLLTVGGRIYHETHYAPLLHMQGSVSEIALDVVRADGTRMPALVNAVVRDDPAHHRQVIRTSVFAASDRRRYEQELLTSRAREREVALVLQRSLLSGALPESERVRTEVVYLPGERGLEVGGDWYDAFWLDAPESIGAVVGDVVGSGLGAAAAMGQLRSAVRAFAAMGLGPGALLEALDRYARRHGVGRMATLAYAEADLRTGTVRYACAGHPPPAVVDADGHVHLLWDGRSSPLDAGATPPSRPEAAYALTAGGTLLLYSDGLVERRGLAMQVGLDALVDSVQRLREDSRPLSEAIADDLLGGGGDDDVCVLALRLTS